MSSVLARGLTGGMFAEDDVRMGPASPEPMRPASSRRDRFPTRLDFRVKTEDGLPNKVESSF